MSFTKSDIDEHRDILNPLDIRPDTRSTLGDDWEDVSRFAQHAVADVKICSLRDKISVEHPPDDTATTEDQHCARDLSELPRSIERSINAQRAATDLQALSEGSEDLKHEIHLASTQVQRALDDYLESYQESRSSMEELIARCQNHVQRRDAERISLDDITCVASNQKVLVERSRAVEDAQLKLSAMRTMLAQRVETANSAENLPVAIQLDCEDDNRSEISDVSSSIPPVAEEYFKAARDAFVTNEQLAELEHEYTEASTASEQDHGLQELSTVATEERENVYQRKRQELAAALAIAHYRSHAKREICLTQGIDPERYRYRRPLNHLRQSFMKSRPAPLATDNETLQNPSKTHESVEGWLQQSS